jgi:hypothetical protein
VTREGETKSLPENNKFSLQKNQEFIYFTTAKYLLLVKYVQGDSSSTTRTINPIKKLVKITKL